MTTQDESVLPQESGKRWWVTALMAACFAAAMWALTGPRTPDLPWQTLAAFAATFTVVMFCTPVEFFRRMAWVVLTGAATTIGIFVLEVRGDIDAGPLVGLIVENARWLTVTLIASAILFSLIDYLQGRSAAREDVLADPAVEELSAGEELEEPEAECVETAEPVKKRKVRVTLPPRGKREIRHPRILAGVLNRHAECLASLSERLQRVERLPIETQWFEERLDAALERCERMAAGGDTAAASAIGAARQTGDVKEILGVLAAAVEQWGEDPGEEIAEFADVRHELAAVALCRGDLPSVEKALSPIGEHVTPHRETLLVWGHVAMLAGHLEQAREAYRGVVQVTEGEEARAVALSNLGLAHQARGDLDDAERMFRMALEIHEKTGNARGMAVQYGNLGAVYHERGSRGKAERLFDLALEIDERLGLTEGRIMPRSASAEQIPSAIATA